MRSQPGQKDRHDWYYSDAYRTIANIGLDYLWFACDPWEKENADRLQTFYYETARDNQDGVFLIDGTPVDKKRFTLLQSLPLTPRLPWLQMESMQGIVL